MAHRSYLVHYPNGFKRHVSQQEILLLGRSIEQTGPKEYLAKTMVVDGARTEPDYYPGSFIFEFKQRRFSECMESSEAQILRLQQQNLIQN